MSREEGEGQRMNDSSSHWTGVLVTLRFASGSSFFDWSVVVPGTVSFSLRKRFHRHSTGANFDRAPGQDRQQQSWFVQ